MLIGMLAISLAGVAGAAPGGRYPPLQAKGEAVATCAHSMRGIGIPLSQRPSKSVGAFGMFEFTPDHRRLRRYRNALLRDKAPVGVAGDATVTVTVPLRPRHRVALGYAGARPARLAKIEFEPCPHKARTAWAGGLTLRDRKPVTLLVAVGGGPARPLRLGRP